MADQSRGARRPARWAALWLLAPLVIAVLGGWRLSQDHSFWYDELYTAEVAPLPLDHLAEAVIEGEGTVPHLRDAPPSYNAPYYAVAHMWLKLTGLAPDERGLRLLSLVAMVGAVAVFTRAAARVGGPELGPALGTVAGLLAATNPFVVEYSVEARSYGLAVLASALCALGLARWLEGSGRALVLYGAAAAAAGLAHWFALLVPGALALAAVALRRRRAVPIVVATAVAAVPALALVALTLANGVAASGAEWLRPVGTDVPRRFLMAWSGENVALALGTIVFAVAGLRVGGRDRSRSRRVPSSRQVAPTRHHARVLGAAWAGIPVIVVTVLELLRPVFVPRYLLPAMLGLPLLMALGILRTGRRASVAGLAAMLTLSVWATVAHGRLGPREDIRGAVTAVAADHAPGQPVVAAARWDALGLDHYARRRHPALVPALVLSPTAVPPAATVWVVRRAATGVKGDPGRLAVLDADLDRRRLHVTVSRRFHGRLADVVVQRWDLREAAGGPGP